MTIMYLQIGYIAISLIHTSETNLHYNFTGLLNQIYELFYLLIHKLCHNMKITTALFMLSRVGIFVTICWLFDFKLDELKLKLITK